MARKYITVITDEDAPVNDPHALISVVMPIYNVSEYLDQALQSVRNQRYKKLEIICVNDGSTDNSLEIIKKHAAKDARIKIIDKQNEGYGASCNRGISEASGEWIAIVEPDDWIDENMYGDMLMFASSFMTKIDIVKTPYWRVTYPDTSKQVVYKCPFNMRVNQSKRPFKIADEPELLRHHPCIWSALYRKSFLDEKKIRMRPIPGAGWADNPFMVETYCQADAIVYLDRAFYHYREETPDEIAMFSAKNWRVPFERWNDMQDVLERLGVSDERILLAHIKRGFTYAGGVLEQNSLEGNPELANLLRQMFERMSPDLVEQEREISPNQKRLYARVMGVSLPLASRVGYVAYLLGKGAYSLRNTGVRQTLHCLNAFTRSYKVRTHGLSAGGRAEVKGGVQDGDAGDKRACDKCACDNRERGDFRNLAQDDAQSKASS